MREDKGGRNPGGDAVRAGDKIADRFLDSFAAGLFFHFARAGRFLTLTKGSRNGLVTRSLVAMRLSLCVPMPRRRSLQLSARSS